MPSASAARTISASRSSPWLCPSVRARPCRSAHRPLPSMITATCIGQARYRWSRSCSHRSAGRARGRRRRAGGRSCGRTARPTRCRPTGARSDPTARASARAPRRPRPRGRPRATCAAGCRRPEPGRLPQRVGLAADVLEVVDVLEQSAVPAHRVAQRRGKRTSRRLRRPGRTSASNSDTVLPSTTSQ